MRSPRRPLVVLSAATTSVLASIVDARLALAQTTSTVRTSPNAVTKEGSPTSSAGLYVFAGVCLVILIGTAVLFLRHRRSSTARTDRSAPPPSE